MIIASIAMAENKGGSDVGLGPSEACICRQKERLGRIRPSPSQPFPSPQQKPGSWGEPRLTSREESGLSGAWTREDGTHVDSVASGGIWGSQGAGAPHEIHAAFKVSE